MATVTFRQPRESEVDEILQRLRKLMLAGEVVQVAQDFGHLDGVYTGGATIRITINEGAPGDTA